ncbi:MAG: glutamine-hydrolyzing carbamoyl-phosphate synthase small subunit [Bacillota bacterium]
MKAFLVLEDGTLFSGEGFGAAGKHIGEVVFNTSMTGYQEVISDPSYCSQIITMTYPLIGNYGINDADMESTTTHLGGLIVHRLAEMPNNWRAKTGLSEFLADRGVIGLQGIDTRALAKKLRQRGTMMGIIAAGSYKATDLLEEVRTADAKPHPSPVYRVTTLAPYTLHGSGYHVAVVDFGVKQNIIRSLMAHGCKVTVFPAATSAAEVLGCQPDGVLLSNGPGDPKKVTGAVTTIRELLGRVPIFGICLGHQLLGLAMGGDTYKLPYGHRGANHPVKDLQTGRVYITSQNHGYALVPDSLRGNDVEITHVNLNDGTVEGIKNRFVPAFSVQYHPEAWPGPEDSRYLFDSFMGLIRQSKH